MKRVIDAAFKEYNANTNYHNTGDCVKRSLSLAYGLDYDEVSKELNRIKRQIHASGYNVSPVFNKFMSIHGLDRTFSGSLYTDPSFFGLDSSCTVEEFSENITQGTYIILCGQSKNSSTHMVCILDGDIWDSWDSSEYLVNKVYIVEEANSSKFDDISIEDIVPEIEEYLLDYLNSIKEKKMNWAEFSVSNGELIDKYGYEIYLRMKIDPNILESLGIRSSSVDYHIFTIRLNPRLNLAENMSSIKEKIRYQAREWSWSCRKAVQDAQEANSMEVNPRFHGNRSFLLKIPQEFRSKIIQFEDRGSNDYYDRYYVLMDADPNDPRYDENDPVVSFYAESIKELKDELNDYKESFSRYGYDY